jgi:hypothetical protein
MTLMPSLRPSAPVMLSSVLVLTVLVLSVLVKSRTQSYAPSRPCFT